MRSDEETDFGGPGVAERTMSTTLSCVLIGSGRQLIACAERWRQRGHRIMALVSVCPEACAWADAHAVARCAPDDQESVLAREPFDYLFSIVNHAITPEAVLALPRRLAINYHDSPLPRFAGFNSTAWAILDGQTTYAVSWHEMTAAVDGGRVLLQVPVEIREDDTAFTLGVKCAEAGVRSFEALVDRLERSPGAPETGAPEPVRDFHLRSDRPGLALLDLTRPASALSALVRALNFGPDDNWMAKPKLLVPGGLVVVSEARVVPTEAGAPPGRVLSLDARGLHVATGDGSLLLTELSALDGAPLDSQALRARFGLMEGESLPLAAEWAAAAQAFDAQITKHERFWVDRLTTLRAPELPELSLATGEPELELLACTLPPALRAADAQRRESALIGTLASYVARVGEDGPFDLALHKALAPGLATGYASAAPLRCTPNSEQSFASLEASVVQELANHAKRQTYARDVWQRYRALRAQPAPRSMLPVGVRVEPALEGSPGLVEGTQLTLVLPRAGDRFAWVYDRRALTHDAMARLAARFDALLVAALADPQQHVAQLPLLPDAERELLLRSWQDTEAPYPSELCVHQLFEQQAARTPEATALVFREQTLSYRALNQRANQVAQRLREAGVGPEVLVGICMERSIELVVGLLAILKAGGAYVPLDPAYPRERLGLMLEDAKAPVLLTQRRLSQRLPAGSSALLCIDELETGSSTELANPGSGVASDNLAYVIFTSGSTGRPKGVMVRHRNVVNFFTGMDARIGTKPGVWLAVTSISFDISVLELFWTLARGFQLVMQEESDRASLSAPARAALSASNTPMDFGLFYFAADSGASTAGGNPYRLLLEGAKFADTHGFSTVWTPERHFHAFGGLYPNPAITTAALSTITQRVALRAGSVVLPLHNPLRVAEDWAVIDQLSGGRVGLSFASGWHVNDFAFYPEHYEKRREIMLESIESVLKLWRGEKLAVTNGAGQPIEVGVLPRPVQARPPLWIASAGSVDTFKLAGKLGVNVLTNMLGQDLADLKSKLAAYRAARREHGHDGPGQVTVMLHTFVCGDTEEARRLAKKPFCDYLASSFDLVKVAPWMFPAFRQPSKSAAQDAPLDASAFTPEDMQALLDHAFDRYFDSAGLFGTPERALALVEQLKSIGVDELACLIDFGIDPEEVLASLPHLDRLRQLANPQHAPATREEDYGIAAQLRRHKITHLQCTPSLARMLLEEPGAHEGLAALDRLLLGGEALPADLVEALLPRLRGQLLNMYGPTETTIWSTSCTIESARGISIGTPIANTTIRVLDARGMLCPVGASGELCIGGAGVVRGYLGRDDLTAERFVPDPFAPGQRLYRTGDLARYRADGQLEFLGRLDHQVKISGYRIELGEIESVLSRHPAVRQSVVSARGDAQPQLVAYLTTTGRDVDPHAGEQRVAHWRELWDEAYRGAREGASAPDPRFDTAGWKDSYSGQPLPGHEMREWLDATAQRLLALSPRRVLELGCGTGMVLYRLLPHVEHYTAVDLSPHALETIRRELEPSEAARVSLLQRPAHALEGMAEHGYDTVVLNSVAQYFPDAGYLVDVLRRASELVKDGGHIFVGDVRSLEQLPLFQTLVELSQAPSQLAAAELAPRIARRIAEDSELSLSEAFFHALVRELPRLRAVDVRLKPGSAHNEMNCFRYDVVLYVGETPAPMAADVQPCALRAPQSLAEVTALLASEPALVVLSDLENARLHSALYARRAIAEQSTTRVDQLREQLATAPAQGIDPAALFALDPRYEAELTWAASGDAGRFDAVLRHKQRGPRGRFPFAAPTCDAPALRYAHDPKRREDQASLQQELRAHLREFLPEYMVPTTFVFLSSFPLTPNGKIDRKALPAPARTSAQPEHAHQPPSNDLERTISEIWGELLQLPRVGRSENIFDLGANSLLTAQANQRLSARLERKVSLVSMFRFPTVAALAAHLASDERAPATQPPDRRERERVERQKDAATRRRELRQARSAGG